MVIEQSSSSTTRKALSWCARGADQPELGNSSANLDRKHFGFRYDDEQASGRLSAFIFAFGDRLDHHHRARLETFKINIANLQFDREIVSNIIHFSPIFFFRQ